MDGCRSELRGSSSKFSQRDREVKQRWDHFQASTQNSERPLFRPVSSTSGETSETCPHPMLLTTCQVVLSIFLSVFVYALLFPLTSQGLRKRSWVHSESSSHLHFFISLLNFISFQHLLLLCPKCLYIPSQIHLL